MVYLAGGDLSELILAAIRRRRWEKLWCVESSTRVIFAPGMRAPVGSLTAPRSDVFAL